MWRIRAIIRACRLRRRGTATVEFALAVPVVLLMMGWVYDYSTMVRNRTQLASGVANAAQYAMLSGSGVSSATLQSVLQKSSFLTGVSANVAGPACYCTAYGPTRLVSAVCGSTCAAGGTAVNYITVTGTYVFAPLLPGLSRMTKTTLSESASVMVP